MQISFTYAQEKDLPRIVKTYNSTIAAGEATADLKKVTIASKLEWFHHHSPNTRPLWIVEADGKYAGWLSFNSFYGRPAYNGTVEISIYLEARFRGKGLGKKCLAFAISESPKRGIHTLLGFIFAHNNASVALFKQFKFKKYGHLPEVANMNGTMRDLLIMGRKVKAKLL